MWKQPKNYCRDRTLRELNLPHREPILFAKEILSLSETEAIVRVEFPTIPTLPMLVESAAQSSAAFSKEDITTGFLVTLKNISLLEKLDKTEYLVTITIEHTLDSLTYFKFIINDSRLVASGVFVIAIK